MDEARKPKFSSNIAPVSADHDWILGVVADLKAYAERNGLDQIQVSATAMLAIARCEILDKRENEGAMVMPFDIAPRKLN